MPPKNFDFQRAFGLESRTDKKESDTQPQRPASQRHFLGQDRTGSTSTSDQQAGSSSGESPRQSERLTEEQIKMLDARYQSFNNKGKKEITGNLPEYTYVQLSIHQMRRNVTSFTEQNLISEDKKAEWLESIQIFEDYTLNGKETTYNNKKRLVTFYREFAEVLQKSEGMSTVSNIVDTEERMIALQEKEADIKNKLDELHLDNQERHRGIESAINDAKKIQWYFK